MNHEGSVLRIDLKGPGETFIWTSPAPLLAAEVVQEYLPTPADDLFGPNVAFTSIRLARDAFFVATVSRWYKRDEFQRRGLSLAQGEIVTFNPVDPSGFLRVCERFLSISLFHKSDYVSLGETLETLATAGSNRDAKRFVAVAGAPPIVNIDSSSADLLFKLVEHLRSEIKSRDDRIRIYIDFPAPSELGLCTLTGLQARLAEVSKVGGGGLGRFEGMQHIASPEDDIAGFRYVDLARLLVKPPQPQVGESTERSGEQHDSNRQDNALTESSVKLQTLSPQVSALRKRYLALVAYCLPIIVSLVFIFLGLSYAEQQRNNIKQLRAAVERLRWLGPTPAPFSPVSQHRTVSQPSAVEPQRGQELSKLTKEMFDQDRSVREGALMKFEKEWSLDPNAISNLLGEGEANKNNKFGVLLTLQFLKRRDMTLLEPLRARLVPFLTEVRENGPGTRKEVDKILARLNER